MSWSFKLPKIISEKKGLELDLIYISNAVLIMCCWAAVHTLLSVDVKGSALSFVALSLTKMQWVRETGIRCKNTGWRLGLDYKSYSN